MEESSEAKNVEMRVQLMFPDIHTKEFQCPICAKYFSRKFTLDAHMLIHKGEKPHACPFCGKCFRQKGTLMRHKALHSTKNLFHCSLCNRGFRQKNVFIHHLKHRHNVSVETLDRRKYRTELKDYQSIMDTLPPFVHADSTAIASSEKHFDAVLFESIKKPGGDSSQVLEEAYLGGSNLQNAQTNVSDKSCYSDSQSQIKNDSLHANECDNLYLKERINSNESDCNEEILVNEEHSEDIKPDINSNFSEKYTTVSSPNPAQIFRSLITDSKNLVSPQSFNDENSNDENLICTPCQLSFTCEVEFQCHLKTHVQSVLGEDVSSKHHRSMDLQKSFDVSTCTQFKDGSSLSKNMLGPVLPIISRSFNGHADILNSNISEEEHVPIKLEMLNSEVKTPLSPNKNEFEFTVSSSRNNLSNSDLKCPVCNAILRNEKAFRNHSKEHDSFSLLKLISELLRSPCVDQNHVSSSNALSHEKSFPNIYSEKSQNLKEMSSKVSSQLKKPTKKIQKSAMKRKSPLKAKKCIQCNERFSSKLLFEYHRQFHLRSKGFFCKCCKRGFLTKQLLLSHTRIYHMKSFTCSKCSRIFCYRKLFQFHQEKCKASAEFKTSNGSCLNFPVVNFESLLNSNMDGIIGVIPVCSSSLSGGIKVGIPVMSISQAKALYVHQSKG